MFSNFNNSIKQRFLTPIINRLTYKEYILQKLATELDKKLGELGKEKNLKFVEIQTKKFDVSSDLVVSFCILLLILFNFDMKSAIIYIVIFTLSVLLFGVYVENLFDKKDTEFIPNTNNKEFILFMNEFLRECEIKNE